MEFMYNNSISPLRQHVSLQSHCMKSKTGMFHESYSVWLQMHSRRAALDVHEFDGRFQGAPAHFKVTSVIGHVLSIDFPAKFQSWETTEPSSLFDAPTIKSESNPKVYSLSCMQGRNHDLQGLLCTCLQIQHPIGHQMLSKHCSCKLVATAVPASNAA